MVVFAIIVAGVIFMPRTHSIDTTYVAYMDNDTLTMVVVAPHHIIWNDQKIELQSLNTPDNITYEVDSTAHGNYYVRDMNVVPVDNGVIFYRRDDPRDSRIFSTIPLTKD